MDADGRGKRRPYEYFNDALPRIRGTFGSYDGSGYMMDFNLSPDRSVIPPETVYAKFVSDLSLLKSNNWLTAETRAVIVSFTVFNFHFDLWQSVDFLFEAPPHGGQMWGFAQILPFRPNINETSTEDLVTKMDYIRLALALYLLIVMRDEVLHKIKNQTAGYQYFRSLNGCTDVGVVIIVFTLNILRPIYFNGETEQAVIDTKLAFKTWSSSSSLYGEVIVMEGLLFFLIMWRMLSFYRLNRQFYLYWRFLGRAFYEFRFIFVLLIPAFIGFVVMMNNIFGQFVPGFDNTNETLMSILQTTKGHLSLDKMFAHDRLWTVLFCLKFFFVVPFLMFNVFAAIMIDAYYTVHLTQGGDPAPYAWNRYRWMRWVFPDLIINNLPTWMTDKMTSPPLDGH